VPEAPDTGKGPARFAWDGKKENCPGNMASGQFSCFSYMKSLLDASQFTHGAGG